MAFRTIRNSALVCALITVSPAAIHAQQPAPGTISAPAPSYVEMVDLVIDAPLVVDATIASTTRIKGAEAANVPPGFVRYYVEADVTALIRGPRAIPPRIGYVLDAPLGPDGRQPRYKKARVLLFARSVAGSANQVQLVGPEAQRGWSPELDALTRRIAGEILAGDAPPIVTGVGNAFHVPGSLPGEGETQVFLTTQDNRPVSLSILRRPGEQPRWAVALSEIVDDSAGPPPRDTLLWYRLACSLPRQLPARSTQAMEPADAAVAQEDYRFVLEQLGPCRRAAPPVA
ncbi:hypothetical protein SAMN05428950_101630 [Sphingomonas sp. OV641]|uniref:hypothetical protein n=1 Tax=Sphingomonas sp. OV641 TaxID=1881068 RepID=UPI0008CBEFF9|nr:hypothetical protein [Sphingomonas sp. OV641]SEI94120.1 hypothetical protein SAMN05428950_101630 [Sphingomonas sp. OV641]